MVPPPQLTLFATRLTLLTTHTLLRLFTMMTCCGPIRAMHRLCRILGRPLSLSQRGRLARDRRQRCGMYRRQPVSSAKRSLVTTGRPNDIVMHRVSGRLCCWRWSRNRIVALLNQCHSPTTQTSRLYLLDGCMTSRSTRSPMPSTSTRLASSPAAITLWSMFISLTLTLALCA